MKKKKNNNDEMLNPKFGVRLLSHTDVFFAVKGKGNHEYIARPRFDQFKVSVPLKKTFCWLEKK